MADVWSLAMAYRHGMAVVTLVGQLTGYSAPVSEFFFFLKPVEKTCHSPMPLYVEHEHYASLVKVHACRPARQGAPDEHVADNTCERFRNLVRLVDVKSIGTNVCHQTNSFVLNSGMNGD